MNENLRLFFSVLWFISFGCAIAALCAVVVSWGDHTEFLYASLALVAISSVGAIITSL
ncbi:MAG: hypothetical protein WA021_05015 [Minisyncoccia bacterium]